MKVTKMYKGKCEEYTCELTKELHCYLDDPLFWLTKTEDGTKFRVREMGEEYLSDITNIPLRRIGQTIGEVEVDINFTIVDIRVDSEVNVTKFIGQNIEIVGDDE